MCKILVIGLLQLNFRAISCKAKKSMRMLVINTCKHFSEIWIRCTPTAPDSQDTELSKCLTFHTLKFELGLAELRTEVNLFNRMQVDVAVVFVM